MFAFLALAAQSEYYEKDSAQQHQAYATHLDLVRTFAQLKQHRMCYHVILLRRDSEGAGLRFRCSGSDLAESGIMMFETYSCYKLVNPTEVHYGQSRY